MRVPTRRVESIDVLRGTVMILMALDHTRDYFGDAAANPTNLATTTVPLFFTRWITHLCAPTFFLLTGTGAYLMSRRLGTRSLPRFLVTRGLWLIVLETIILRCIGWQFNVDFRMNLLGVLWAIGWSMITLAALVRYPPAVSAAFGLTLIAGHNLFDGVRAATLGAAAPLWLVLHQQGLLLRGPDHFLLVAYPLIPWVGVTAIGYAIGPAFAWEADRRRRFLWRAGALVILAFFALRWLNIYGDPQPWTTRTLSTFTVLSFLNTTKYPPSLLFLLMTLGPALLLLRALNGHVPRWLGPVAIFGRVPLFYFVLHVILIHLLALVACWYRYGQVHWVFESPRPDTYPFTQPPGWPVSLPWVYAIWALVVVSLWPACRWYAALKSLSRRRSEADDERRPGLPRRSSPLSYL
jgi:uncharacterized membrane protein